MAPLHIIQAWWRKHHTTRTRDDGGFTVIETTVAMALVFIVLAGTLATFSASVRNIVGGRQRTGAVSVARSVIEDARAAGYDRVGHDLGADATLASDPDVSGSPKMYGGEQLVGAPDPLFPVHEYAVTHDTTTYTIKVYVTWVSGGTADPYKRLTVNSSWEDHNAGISNDVHLSSFLFAAGVPPDPAVEGGSDVDGGTVEVTGTLSGIDLSRAVLFNPSSSADLESLFVREASGQARSSAALLELNAGTPSGCSVEATTAQCDGIVAGTATDSDASTGTPEHDAEGPLYDAGHNLSAGAGILSMALGANDLVESRTTARSCFSCFGTAIGDDDRLAYHWSRGSGPDSASIGFDVGPVDGQLVRMTGASQSTSTLDQDTVSGSHLLTSQARLQMPGVDVVAVNGAPAGFVAAVQISSVDVEVTAQAGPTANPPAVTGDAVTVQVYDTLGGGSLGYRTISATPGQEKEEAASAGFTVGGATVSLTTTVISGGKSVVSTTDGSGTINYADVSLTNWLRITVHLVIVEGGTTLADSMIEFDYGRLAARTQWESV